MNPPVNFQIAKLLKELNFNEPSFYSYYEYHENIKREDYEIPTHVNYLAHKYTAPTIIDTVFWILKNYGIWIYAKPVNSDSTLWQAQSVKGTSEAFSKGAKCESIVKAYEYEIETVLRELKFIKNKQ